MDDLSDEVVGCRRCPRLVAWRETVAAQPRASFSGQQYWGRPIPGFGDRDARLVLVGLAPAAHGGNRTGRIFTGDRSGDWLWAAMWRAGLANQPESISRDDGLEAYGAWVTAAVRCAPPLNRPTPDERDNCLPFLERELALLAEARVLLALGGFAYDACWRLLGAGRPRPPFGHGREVEVGDGRWVVCSYHPSQQNTFTGRLTIGMFDGVLARACQLAGLPSRGPTAGA
jgi:uracil-DNA glycosylase family 4